MSDPVAPKPSRGGALAVGAGIFLSKIAGLVRVRAVAHYLGQGGAAGALTAALRIPNILQNLLGEGVLSASFIPTYSHLLAEGREEDAQRVARTIGTLMALLALVLGAIGVSLAGPLVGLLAGGFEPEKRELTVTLVRIIFPGTALLVMSAWCLGVLNSHRRFFLSYVSPVLWSAAIIGAAIVAGRRFSGHSDDIAIWLAWGSVIGAAAQFLVQVPTVLAVLRGFKPSLAVKDRGVQETIRAFGTILVGRGSVQISGFIDLALASYLGADIVAAMGNAQVLYMLPISLFGMAVSAAELPEMSSATGGAEERAAALRARLEPALRRVVFLVVPSAIAFVAIGAPIVSLLFEGGRFGPADTRIVWIVLSGSAIGLSAGTQGRLIGSAFYALKDPRRPLYAALVRVSITGVAGYLLAMPLRDAFGYDAVWGAFGLTASAGFAAWVELMLLVHWLRKRIGPVKLPTQLGLAALAIAALAGSAGYGVDYAAHALHLRRIICSGAAIATFGVIYLGVSAAVGLPEAQAFLRRALRRK
ncbi:MAG TPA: murein biosynthesis integral membrane protein MurJ [Kofleriaceae bacterium]|jgi:putative peptidoglycan lipid II flippase